MTTTAPVDLPMKGWKQGPLSLAFDTDGEDSDAGDEGDDGFQSGNGAKIAAPGGKNALNKTYEKTLMQEVSDDEQQLRHVCPRTHVQPSASRTTGMTRRIANLTGLTLRHHDPAALRSPYIPFLLRSFTTCRSWTWNRGTIQPDRRRTS